MKNLIVNFKYHKNINFLKENKFSINCGNIMDGKLKMLPQIKWIFIQANDDPNVFYVDLAFKYKDYLGGWMPDNVTQFIGLHSPSLYNIYRDNNSIYNYGYPGFLPYKHDIYIQSFYENVKPDDIYTYNDFVGIIKSVTDEINKSLYINDDEESINLVEKKLRKEMFSDEELYEIIKKAHRNYMDNLATFVEPVKNIEKEANSAQMVPITAENVSEVIDELYKSPLGVDEELITMIKRQFPERYGHEFPDGHKSYKK